MTLELIKNMYFIWFVFGANNGPKILQNQQMTVSSPSPNPNPSPSPALSLLLTYNSLYLVTGDLEIFLVSIYHLHKITIYFFFLVENYFML